MDILKIKNDGNFYGVVGKNNTIVVPFVYDEIIRTFSSGLINVRKKDKWGCLDLYGNIAIPLIYDWIFPFGKDDSSTTRAKRDGKWGIIDRKGDDVIPCVYDNEIVFKQGRAFVTLNGKNGLIDEYGNSIIPCHYSYLKPFVNSSKLIKVMENNKWGVIDEYGSITIPLIYDEIGELYTDYIVVKEDIHYGLVNLKGEKIIPNEYDEIDRFYHDNNHFEIGPNSDVFAVLKDEKWKYVLANNDYRNNNQYDWISCQFENNNYIVKQDEKFGVINRLGRIIVPIIYPEIHTNCGYYVLYSQKHKGLCDSNGKLMLPLSYANIEIISNKSAIVEKETSCLLFIFDNANASIEYDEIRRFYGTFCKVTQNGKCGIINDEGEIIIPLIYDYIGYCSKNTIEVVKNHKFGIIDLSGHTVIPVKYDTIEKKEIRVETDDGAKNWINYIGREIIPPIYGDAIIMKYDGKYGVINSKGIEQIPFKYDKIDFFGGVFIVKLKNKHGALDINNKQIVSTIYDDIKYDLGEKLFMVKENNLWGLLDNTSAEIIPPRYDNIDSHFSCHRLAVCINKKWGFIDENGYEIIPCIYDETILSFEDNHCEVILNGERFVIDIHGNRISII